MNLGIFVSPYENIHPTMSSQYLFVILPVSANIHHVVDKIWSWACIVISDKIKLSRKIYRKFSYLPHVYPWLIFVLKSPVHFCWNKGWFHSSYAKTMIFMIKYVCTQAESSITLKLVSVSVTCQGITLMKTVAEAAESDGNGLVWISFHPICPNEVLLEEVPFNSHL